MAVPWIGNTLLVQRVQGYAEMGVFSAAYRWRDVILFFPSMLSIVTAALHPERMGKHDYVSVRKILYGSLTLVVAVVVALTVILALLSPLIMKQYGEDFRGSSEPAFVVVLFCTLLQALAIPFTSVVGSAGWFWQSLVGGVAWGIIVVGSAYFLTDYGALGLAWAHLIGAVIQLTVAIILAISVIRSGSKLTTFS